MKDELVGFETAKSAKEKGFNEGCEYLYLLSEELQMVGNYNFVDEDEFPSYAAPTQSLLQKWLREVHNI